MALEAESGDGIGEDSEVVGELGAGEAEEEGLVVGDDLTDAFERDDIVSETDYVGIGERLPEVDELGHESRDLEGQDADDASFTGFERRLLQELRLGGSHRVEAAGNRSFDLDQ